MTEDERQTDCGESRNGHTMRRVHCGVFHSFQQEMSISRAVLGQRSGARELAVSVADEFFDPALLLVSQSHYHHRAFRGDRLLTSQCQWTHVIDTLQSHAVHCRARFDKSSRDYVVEYSLPVIGHVLLDNDDDTLRERDGKHGKRENKNNASQREWLQWNGKFHDPGVVYEFVPSSSSSSSSSALRWPGGALRAVCPLQRGAWSLKTAASAAGADELRQRHGGVLLGVGELTASAVTTTRVTRATPRCLEIDLKRVCDVRALSLLGENPRDLEVFPHGLRCKSGRQYRERDRENGLSHRHYRGRRGRRTRAARRAFVYVTRDRGALGWVESYALHARDPLSGGAWRLVGETLRGNSDAGGTQSVEEVAVRARYLRITPIAVHNRAEMRVSVYGAPVTTTTTETSERQRATQRSESEEVVQYTVYPAMRHTHCVDGAERHYKDDYRWATASKRRQARAEELRSDLRENCDYSSCDW